MSGKNSLSDANETERLSKLNIMMQIRQEALDINDRLMASDIEVVRAAEKDLQQLIDGFYKENKDMMAPQQYEAAKKDFGYFLVLVEMAVAHYGPEGYDTDPEH